VDIVGLLSVCCAFGSVLIQAFGFETNHDEHALPTNMIEEQEINFMENFKLKTATCLAVTLACCGLSLLHRELARIMSACAVGGFFSTHADTPPFAKGA